MAGRTTTPITPAKLAERFAALALPVHFFFDFDGTLSPLAPTPARARLPARTRRVLAALAQRAQTRVTIVSARTVRELARKSPPRSVALVGLYGLERRSPGKSLAREALPWDPRFWSKLRRELERAVALAPGAFVEWKPPAIAVHDRAVAAAAARRLERVVRAMARREHERVEVRPGSRVLELVPRGMPDKGVALVRALEAEPARSVVYVGDSGADEPAFRVARARGGLAVRVGPRSGKSAATHALADPRALVLALERFTRALRRGPGRRASP
jgi:trehalose 6-phosphate phosphatase